MSEVQTMRRVRGGSVNGHSIYSDAVDDMLLAARSIGTGPDTIRKQILEKLQLSYTTQQLRDRLRALSKRRRRTVAAAETPNTDVAKRITWTDDVDAALIKLAKEPFQRNNKIAFALRQAFPAAGYVSIEAVMKRKRVLRKAGKLGRMREFKPRLKTMYGFKDDLANDVFQPKTQLELDWGATALDYWSTPGVDDARARALLHPGGLGRDDFGFYLLLPGEERLTSAWEAYFDDKISLPDLIAAAKVYFRLCELPEGKSARIWQARIRSQMYGAGLSVGHLKRFIDPSVAWSMAQKAVGCTGPVSQAMRRAIEGAIAAALASDEKRAA